MIEIAQQAIKFALAKGASEVAANAVRERNVDVQWRDGKVDRISESTTRSLSVSLYVDGRYSHVSTSDLRPDAVERFIENALAMARSLEKDPFRALPDPALYQGRSGMDLQIFDPSHADLTAQRRRELAQQIEAAARAGKGAEAIISVTTNVSDGFTESFRVHSNGFEGLLRRTMFGGSAEVSVRDPDGRKPEEGQWMGARLLAEVPDAAQIGQAAAARALRRIGAKKTESKILPVVLENRAAGRLVSSLLSAMTAQSLQQKRSFLEGKLGQAIGNARLELTDDPLIPKGFGSRPFDGEGLAAKSFPLFEAGVLRGYYVDNYYGRKLQMRPTTGGTSNLRWKLGDADGDKLVGQLKDGLLVTGFLGGNSNNTTGEFSLGIAGFRIRNGQQAEPISEMNLSGNNLEIWKRLAAVGNDPYPYSSMRTPTLVFDGMQVAGT